MNTAPTRATRARVRFIARATAIATTSTPKIPRAIELANAAIASDRQAKWMTLQTELNAWQRVHSLHGPVIAAPRFDAIAQALGSETRWDAEEPSCGRCNDTGATCCECSNASDNCDCPNGSIEVPCKCEGVNRA